MKDYHDDSEPTGAVEDTDFIERLAEGLERIERGATLDIQALCADRPEIAARLESALHGATDLPQLNAAAAEVDPRIGEVVANRYELRSRLGAGGMGVVYEAFDNQLSRIVAVKMMQSSFASGTEHQARFAREADVLAAIEHTGIVSIYDRGYTASGEAFLVMPRLRGHTASELVEAPPDRSPSSAAVATSDWLATRLGAASQSPDPDLELDDSYVRQVVRWTARIARALHPVHEAGIIHRDIKPSNVFVRTDGSPVLIDFGLVTLGRDDTVAVRDAAIGTPAYMAPEQLDPKAELEPTTDVYGLTATLYHLLTFARPYDGSPSQVLAALQRDEPTPASQLRPGLPRDMQAILDMGMARDVARRYPSAAALADDLEAWLAYRPIVARPISAAGRAWRRWRRTTTFRVTVAAVVSVAIAVASMAFWEQRHEARRIGERNGFDKIAPVALIGLPHLRVGADAEAEGRIEAAIDAMVASANEPSPSRLIRAGFRLDRGRRKAAAADMRAIADYYGTELTQTLAARYEAATENRILIADLQASEHPVDRLALAFHETRAEDYSDAKVVELLQGRSDLLASELLIHSQIGIWLEKKASEERRAALRVLLDEANRLRGLRGSTSAFLARSRGTICMVLQLSREAQNHFRTALTQTEDDYSVWHNLALSHMRLQEPIKLRESLARAIRIQPKSLRVHELMIEVEIDARNFEKARYWINKAPFTKNPKDKRRRNQRLGLLLLEHAIHELERKPLEASHRQASREFAGQALQHFANAREPGDESWTFLMLLAKCLEEPSADTKQHLFEFANRDPLDPRYLAGIHLLYRETTDEQAQLFIELIAHILETIAPGKFFRTKDK